MKSIFKPALAAVALSAAFLFSSCSGIIGYSVLLWNVPEQSLADGTIVPVYVKSNISHVYVIGVPETKEKIEVPLWKLSEPESKGRAQQTARRYENYANTYAKCVLDGLPIRADKVNTSKQVYRLKKNEIVRALYEGEGSVPTNGKQNLEGKWLRVLTSDGTLGWCFSHNLRLFVMNADGTYGDGAEEASVQETDEVMEKMLATKWYPDYYSGMISSRRIDLEYFTTDYMFDTGASSGTVTVKLPTLDLSYPYAGVKRGTDGDYYFEGTPLRVTVRNSRVIVLKYTDERGMPSSFNFVALEEGTDIAAIIEDEKHEREESYLAMRANGPTFRSSNYGTLTFDEDAKFLWSGFNRLVPGVIPRGIKGSGTVQMKYFIPSNLKSEWDGVVSFIFDESATEVNFLYKTESSGLRLAVAEVEKIMNEATGRNRVTVTLPVNSIVLFFQN